MTAPLCPRCHDYPDTVMHAPRCKGEWTGERFAVRAVAESMRANDWKLRAERAESVARGQQVEIREQRATIDAVRALLTRPFGWDAAFGPVVFTDPDSGKWEPLHDTLRAILDPAPETPADCCVRQMADPMWCHLHEGGAL